MSEKKSLQKSSKSQINDFLDKVAKTPVRDMRHGTGRLLFAMDATASREPTWDMASQIQGQMFEETHSNNPLAVQLAYYRGYNEFYTSNWHTSATGLLQTMSAVTCLGGMTQIERILEHAIEETKIKKINAVVFVGDAMEENIDKLCILAGQLGILGVPVFVFQENIDPIATMAFKQIAKLSKGAYCTFDASSAQQLRDLLGAVAAYATGGHKALQAFSNHRGGITRLLTNNMNK